MSQNIATVKFSDGRRVTVSASTEAEARRKAYRIDGGFSIVSVDFPT